jgi:hypothetical protein
VQVKIGDVKFGVVVGQCEYGLMISIEDEVVYARSTHEIELYDEVIVTFKSFSVGCYWEVSPANMTV